MKSKIIIHALNLLLVVMLLSMVIVPTLGGSFLVIKGPIDLPGSVAGWRSRSANFTVTPNTIDFSERVSFQSLQASDDAQVEKVTLSNFPGYLAIYNHLYAVENHSQGVLKVRVRLLEVPQSRTYSFLTVSLSLQNQPYATRLLHDEPVGVVAGVGGEDAVEALPDDGRLLDHVLRLPLDLGPVGLQVAPH